MPDSTQSNNSRSGEELPPSPNLDSDTEMTDLGNNSHWQASQWSNDMEVDSESAPDDDLQTPFLDMLDDVLDEIESSLPAPSPEEDMDPDDFFTKLYKFAKTKIWPGADPTATKFTELVTSRRSWDFFHFLNAQRTEEYILRVQDGDGPAVTPPDVHRAFVAKNTFAQDVAGMLVPKIVAFDYTTNNVLEKPYVLQTMVPGKSLDYVCMSLMSQADKCQLAAELGLHCRKMLKTSSSMPGEICLPDDLRPGAFHVQEVKAHRPLNKGETAVQADLSDAKPFEEVENQSPIYSCSKIIQCMLADHSIREGQAYHRLWNREGNTLLNPTTRTQAVARRNSSNSPESNHEQDDEDLEAYRQHMRDPLVEFERRFFDEGERGMFDDMDVTNPHRLVFARNQDILNALMQLTVRLEAEGYLGSDQDRYTLMGMSLHERHIMVNLGKAPGEPLVSAFMGELSFGPSFSACKPPLGLWSEAGSSMTNTQHERVAAQMPKDEDKAQIRKIFDMAAGPEFVKMAYDTKYRLARGLYDFAWLGLQTDDRWRVLDAQNLLREAAEVFEDFELPAYMDPLMQ